MTMDAVLDRSIGALLGLAIGDALGAPAEGMRRGSYPRIMDFMPSDVHGLSPGGWTDDTAMALCLAESLLACRGLDPHDLMRRFLRWYRLGENACGGRTVGIGQNTRAALEAYEGEGDFGQNDNHPGSIGNGCVMRLAPVAIRYRRNLVAARDAAIAQARTTHSSNEAAEASGLMAKMLVAGLRTGDPAAITDVRFSARTPRVNAIAHGSYQRRSREEISSAARAVDTLEAALWCLHQADSFEDAVVTAVNLGGDTDTIGATTGQLAGAVFGASAIPGRWVEGLHAAERIAALAHALHRAADPD
jgi:ADP-ribosyl-[dinitrogen reductase] hydrolase